MKKILALLFTVVFNLNFALAEENHCPIDHNSNVLDKEMDKRSDLPCEGICPKIEIYNSWARESLSSNSNSAAYMSIHNPNDKDLIIEDAKSASISSVTELHKSFVDERGISRMVNIDKIIIPANTTIELKPADIHVMLIGLKKEIKVGDKFIIELKLEDFENNILVETIVK